MLNANNIRLLTKCDAALLSFRYTSNTGTSYFTALCVLADFLGKRTVCDANHKMHTSH